MFTDESEIVHGRIGGFRELRGKEHVPQLGPNTPNGGDRFQYITILQVTPYFLIPGYCESKKQGTKGTTILSITSPNVDLFSNFFHRQIY